MRHGLAATPRRHQAGSRTDRAVRPHEPAASEEPKLVTSPPTCPVDGPSDRRPEVGAVGNDPELAGSPSRIRSSRIPALGPRRPTPRTREARDYSAQG